MTFIAPWKKNRKQSQSDEVELHGDQILSAMMESQAISTPVPSGHEEKAKESLESIYTLETIDIETVRPLGQPQKIPEPSSPPPKKYSNPQLPLPFAPRFTTQFDSLVIPWVEARGGIATRPEIEERLERVGVSMPIPENSSLIPLEEGVYASDPESAERYHALISRTQTYFYDPNNRYPFQQLINWLEREFAVKWEEFPQNFISKCLTSSPNFCRFKASNHHISIRLSDFID